MAGQLNITPSLEQFQEAATKWRPELLMQPIIGCQDTIQHMTPRPGIRYKENVGAISGNAQFGPYKPSRSTDFNLNVEYRTLETFMGSVHCKFEPNSAASTILGYMAATKGDGQMQAPTALHVLTLIAKGLSESLNDAIWSGVRNASGDTTKDLFDGFDTITAAEIAADKISVANKNYMKLTEEITTANALDIAKEILYSLDPRLRAQELNMYCSQDFADKYNEGYLLTHSGIIYNEQFEQSFVEGSNRRMTLCPLPCLDGTDKFFVAPKENMIYGYDNMSDVERIQVDRFSPWVLTFSAAMFFGVQFRSIDKRMLKVIKLKTT